MIDQLIDAGEAIRKAMDALNAAAPNGRDYYPQGPDAIRKATAAHAARLAKLKSVFRELVAINESIA